MSKPSDAPGFKKLSADWDQKLKDSGFKDIEVQFQGERVLKQSGFSRRYELMDPLKREAKEKIFRQVSECVAHTHFEDEREKQILEMYAAGTPMYVIKRTLGIKGHRCKVYYPIYRWLHIWGIRSWARMQR